MKNPIVLLFILVAGIGIYFYANADVELGEINYNYKLTVEFDTPEGVKSGSSVIEIKRRTWSKDTYISGSEGESKVKGEAIYIDLGNKKHAVALLATGFYADYSPLYRWAIRAFLLNKVGVKITNDGAYKLSKMVGSRKRLEGNLIPTIVTFSEQTKPKSVKILYATDGSNKPSDEVVDNIKEILGEGYALKQVIIEITNDGSVPILNKYLPWISSFRECKAAWGALGKEQGRRKSGHPQYIFSADGELATIN